MGVNSVSPQNMAYGSSHASAVRQPVVNRSNDGLVGIVNSGVNLSSQGKELSSSFYERVAAAAEKSGESLNAQLYSSFFMDYLIDYLMPSDSSAWSGSGLLSILTSASRVDSDLLDILQSAIALKENQAAFEDSLLHGAIADEDYSAYLSKGDSKLEEIANEVVTAAGATTDTEKMYSIMAYVQDSMKYVSDEDNFGVSEYWSTARETIDRGSDDSDYLYSGDCEDGAFLMMGLALAAGVDPDRLRFYGGLVVAGDGASTGGHGWLAFERDDGTWAPVDWCYRASKDSINSRASLAENNYYIGAWYVVNGDGVTIDTTAVDAVNDPNCIDKWDRYLGSGTKDYLFYKGLAAGYSKSGKSIPSLLSGGTGVTTAVNKLVSSVGARGRLADLASAVNAAVNLGSGSDVYRANAIGAYAKASYAA